MVKSDAAWPTYLPKNLTSYVNAPQAYITSLNSKIVSLFFYLKIGQKVDEKWPLTLVDHQNKRKKIFLKPGQMIMFEGSKVLHGRQFPLNGSYYDELVLFFTREENKTNSDYYD